MTEQTDLKNFYFKQLLSSLEFDKVIDIVSKYTLSDLGKYKIENYILYNDTIILEEQFQRIENFRFLLSTSNSFPFQGLFNLMPLIANIEIENYFIESIEFLKIKKVVENIRDIKIYFETIESKDKISKLISFSNSIFYEPSIIKIIEDKIDEEGSVKSSASSELLRIRTIKQTIFKEIDNAFKAQLSKYKTLGFLSDTVESIRQNRRVLAVWAEHKRKVKGIIVDESESGKIVYIEPSETIYLNNDAADLDREELKEIRKILIELTQKISKYKKLFSIYQDFLAELDSLQAKAKFANAIEGNFPKLSSTHKLQINTGFHPILKLKNKLEGKKIVPFTMELDQYKSTMMISGPNAGGKSITLKSIGLMAIMTKAAIPIPALSDSEMPLFKDFYGDFGDHQSIEDELSTYSSKLQNWNFLTQNCNNESLILFDEMGTGTDPSFGAAMAQVILEKCIEKGAMTIATTHFGMLKKFGDEHKSVINASMLFDEEKLEPMYRLNIGTPGSSYTFHIARKMNLEKNLIDRAQKISNTDQLKYDNLLLKLEIKNKDLVRKQNDLEKSDKELKDQIKNWKRLNNEIDLLRKKVQFDKMVFHNEVNIEKEKELREFAEKLKKESNKEQAEQERKKIQQEISEKVVDIKKTFKQIHNIDTNQIVQIGQEVQYIQTQSIGVVEKIERKKAIVVFEHNKLTVPISDLIILKNQGQNIKSHQPRKIVISKEHVSNELDLRGKFVIDAIPELEDFINKALMLNKYECKIIHGRGNLKREVLKTIQSIRNITKFAHGDADSEGDGVTYIYF